MISECSDGEDQTDVKSVGDADDEHQQPEEGAGEEEEEEEADYDDVRKVVIENGVERAATTEGQDTRGNNDHHSESPLPENATKALPRCTT